jgi:hypothetical protein
MPLTRVPQKLQEAQGPWQVCFAETPEHPEGGLEQGKQARGSMLMHVAARRFLLGMIDVLMYRARQRPSAAGRVCGEPTAGWHRDGGRRVHGLDGDIAGRLDDARALPTHPGDKRGAVVGIMAPARLAFRAAPTGSTA